MIYNNLWTYSYTNSSGLSVPIIINSTVTSNIRSVSIKRIAGTISLTGSGALTFNFNGADTSLGSNATTLDATNPIFTFSGAINYLKIDVPDGAGLEINILH